MIHLLDYRRAIPYVLIAVLALISFGMSVRFGFAPIDDQHLIVSNLAVQQFSWSSIAWFFTHFDPELYIPLTFTSFMVDHAIGNGDAVIFHITNLLLHIINTCVLLFIFTTISKRPLASFAAVLLFALHPIQTEAIVWISARKDLLATFFGLLSVTTALKADRTSLMRWYGASIALFLCGLLSKVSIAPLALLMMFIPTVNDRKSKMFFAIPYLVLSMVLGLVAVIGKTDVVSSLSLIDRVLLAGDAVYRTALHILLPFRLHVMYEPMIVELLSVRGVLSIVIPLLFIVCAWICRRRNPLLSIGIGVILLFILPTILNIQVGVNAPAMNFAADRYAYLPMIGLCMIALSLSQRASKNLLIGTIAAICALLIPLSLRQAYTWSEPELLYKHAIEADPTAVQARIAFARLLREQGSSAEAFELLKDGLMYDDARLHVAAGYILASNGQVAEARDQYLTAQTMNPDYAEALFGLAGLAEHEGRNDQAIKLYKEAINLEPRFSAARINLARLLIDQGKTTEAKIHINQVLQNYPFDEDALQLNNNLNKALN